MTTWEEEKARRVAATARRAENSAANKAAWAERARLQAEQREASQVAGRQRAIGRQVQDIARKMDPPREVRVTEDFNPRFMTDDQLMELANALLIADQFDWGKHARPEQLEPAGDWEIWLMLAGRRFGKTRAATEYIRMMCERFPGFRVAAIAKDHRNLRDVCFEGKSGLTKVIPPDKWQTKNYKKGLGDVSLVLNNGSVIIGYTAAEPDAIRGQAFDLIWGDEFAAWPRHRAKDMLDQASFTMGESEDCRMILTTTPKRLPHVTNMLKKSKDPAEKIVVTRGKTSDNTALSAKAVASLNRRYAGTRIGRQEMDGDVLMDVEGALWTGEMIEVARWGSDQEVTDDNEWREIPKLAGVVTGVDASGSADGDECGIVTIGWDKDKVLYVLENATTGGSPSHRYETACLSAYHWGAHEFVYESAYGGDNVAYALENAWKHLQERGEIPTDARCPTRFKSTMKGDKIVRAQPVAQKYEQQTNLTTIRNVYHAIPDDDNGLEKLEDEMTSWEPATKVDDEDPNSPSKRNKSPNAMDAMVHAMRRAMNKLGMEHSIGRASPKRRRKTKGWS